MTVEAPSAASSSRAASQRWRSSQPARCGPSGCSTGCGQSSVVTRRSAPVRRARRKPKPIPATPVALERGEPPVVPGDVRRASPAHPRRAARSRRTPPGPAASRCTTSASTAVLGQPAGDPLRPRLAVAQAPSWRASPGCRRRRAGRAPRRPAGAPTVSEGQPAVPVGVPVPPAGAPMTNGGLLTTRSNVSPRTGSSRSPSRRSDGYAGQRRREAGELQRARPRRRCATTSRQCREACRACTPQPVPTSRVRPTGARGVSWARVVEAPPTPSTCSAGSGPAAPSRPVPRSETTHQPVVRCAVFAIRSDVEPRRARRRRRP